MALDFPNSPSPGDQFTAGGRTWVYVSPPGAWQPKIAGHKSSHATGGSDALTASDIGAAPTSHTHTASQISNSTATGRSLITAIDAAGARSTLGLGNAALATTSTGGNGLDDSGKVATYNFYGQLVSNGLEIKSGSYTTTITGSSSANVTIGTPSSGGYFAVTLNAAGIPDNLVTSSTKTTPVDADSVLMTDSEAAGTPAKRLTFANLWTWILSKLGGNLTIGGTKTWSGQQEATGQAATNGTSVMTRDLGDARYGQIIFAYKSSDASKASDTTLADDSDLKINLPIGIYEIDFSFVTECNGGTSGAKVTLAFSGTSDTAKTGGVIALASGSNAAVSEQIGGSRPVTGGASLFTFPRALFASNNVFNSARGKYIMHVTAAGDLSAQWAQNSSTSTATLLYRGSFIKARKL